MPLPLADLPGEEGYTHNFAICDTPPPNTPTIGPFWWWWWLFVAIYRWWWSMVDPPSASTVFVNSHILSNCAPTPARPATARRDSSNA